MNNGPAVTNDTRISIIAVLFLISITLAVFGQTVAFEFVTYDDPGYVYRNPSLQHGLSPQGLRYALTTTDMSNYTPIVWLTYLAEHEAAGYDPRVFHTTGVLIHTANALLLFYVLVWMTGHRWPSLLAAALFAVHPLHVESVAWVSERKDLLSALFWLLTMGAYTRYVRASGALRYSMVGVLLVFSLLAKPMAVTLPCVLLLLDYWPLRRAEFTRADLGHWLRLGREKIPLFALVAMFSVIGIITQRQSGALIGLDAVGTGSRVINAVLAYVRYLFKTVWPVDLMPYYPLSVSPQPAWHVVAAVLFLAVVSLAAWRIRVRHPYVLVGWLWYLGTLVPVIGFVQVGKQAMADRYTYLPLIGIFIAVAWSLRSLVLARPTLRRTVAVAAVVAIAALAHRAWDQARVWRNSRALYAYTLSVDPGNPLALTNLGQLDYESGRYEAATTIMRYAVDRYPDEPRHRVRLALCYQALGRIEAAYREALRARELAPNDSEIHVLLGDLAVADMRPGDAGQHYRHAVRSDPSSVHARLAYGHFLLEAREDPATAAAQFRAILAVEPLQPDALAGLGAAALVQGDYDEAERWLRRAAGTPTPTTNALLNLAILLDARHQPDEALEYLNRALQQDPGNARARLLRDRLQPVPPDTRNVVPP